MTDKEKKSLPLVSIVMPMRNEENFIARCLDSIVDNDYPSNRFEVLIVDGMSTDRSREIVMKYSKRHNNIKLIDNPKRIRVTANNVGIRAAKGEIIISMDAHVIYAPDYIRCCVELLQTTGATNVGGVQKAVGYNYITKVIALATSTPFGIGDAEFRYLEKEKWVDTVYLGTWYKKTLNKVGYFNENWIRNGDYELNYRIRKTGGRILLSPKIKCEYFVRGSLSKLAKQYFLYGTWRVKTIKTHPDSVRWRHLLPPLLIVWLLLSPILLLIGVKLWWIPIGIYLAYTMITSTGIALLKGIKYLPLMIPTLWTLHLCWGIGFYNGIFRFGFPKINLKTVFNDICGKKTTS
jgi:glycosyltransferase involved in cell wall biosynthesis